MTKKQIASYGKLETAQENLAGQIRADQVYTSDCLKVVSAALMFFSLANKLHNEGTLNYDEMVIFRQCEKWWLKSLGHTNRDTIYEMAARFSKQAHEASERIFG